MGETSDQDAYILNEGEIQLSTHIGLHFCNLT